MNKPAWQRLSRCYKKTFPFRLSVPSFIYPSDYISNTKLLGPYLDEIELLLFEGDFKKMPSQAEITDLQKLSEHFDLGYHVHLPIDIDLGGADPAVRQHAIAVIRYICQLTRQLKPSTYTLHLPVDKSRINSRLKLKSWQDLIMNSLEQIIDRENMGCNFSVETLDYPFEWVRPILEGFNLSVCLDVGHILLSDDDLETVFKSFQNRISTIHLHGVEKGKDHRPLGCLPPEVLTLFIRLLKQFSGIVSVEVFSFEHLQQSLETLTTAWTKEVKPSGPILFEGLT